MNRTFTPFQLWLETRVANGHTLTSIAKSLDMLPSQLTRLRQGTNSFPRPRLEKGLRLTGLSLDDLLAKASDGKEKPARKARPQVEAIPGPDADPVPVPEPMPALEPIAPPAVPVAFAVTPERVQVALQHGLKFGPERALFCDTSPEGDLDAAWQAWCQSREGAKSGPDLSPVPPPPPALYDHLKRDVQRPDYRPAGDAVQVVTDAGNYRINVGKTE